MKRQKSAAELQKELNLLNEEFTMNKKLVEEEKRKFCDIIKNTNPEEIKNTITIEKKYSVWERIKRVLGIN